MVECFASKRDGFVIDPSKFFICEKHWPADTQMVTIPGGSSLCSSIVTNFFQHSTIYQIFKKCVIAKTKFLSGYGKMQQQYRKCEVKPLSHICNQPSVHTALTISGHLGV